MAIIYNWLTERVKFDVKKYGVDKEVFVLLEFEDIKVVKEYYLDHSAVFALNKYDYLSLSFEEMTLGDLYKLLLDS